MHKQLISALVTNRDAMSPEPIPVSVAALVLAMGTFALGLAAASVAQAQGVVYRCPGNPVLYTDALTAKEAKDRGCRALEGLPVTVAAPERRRAAGSPSETAPPPAARARVEPSDQRARDLDRRAILAAELQREEEALRGLRTEYNNGEPERRGDERNYQRYLDRVAELKANIARKEADVAALKREIGKLPAP
jgi:hypothetical protein